MVRAACALGIVLWLSTAAFAQKQAAELTYEGWIVVAVEAYRQGDLDRAREAFQRAHEIEPSARTLRGLGTIDFKAGRHPEAFVALSSALTAQRNPLPPDLALSVKALVEQIRAKVALCELVDAPEGVMIEVDGSTPLLDSEGHIVMAAGRHRLEVRAPGHEPIALDVEPALGAVERVHVQLRATPPASAVPDPAPAPPPLARPGPRPNARVPSAQLPAGRTWTWVTAAGVPVFVAAAAFSWRKAENAGRAVVARCDRERCNAARRTELIEDSPLATYELLTNVAWTLAGASLIATGVAFVLEGEQSEGSTALSVSPGGIVLHAGF
jgi:hypothetical protein